MKATVSYDSDGKPNRITVTDDLIAKTKFKMEGTTAVVYEATPVGGDTSVFLSEVSEGMDYVEQLDFVQAVTMENKE